VPLSAGRIGYVQLGVAGAYDPRTGVIHHVDVPGFDRPGLVTDIEARLATTIDVDNDANLAAVAERRHGAAIGVDSFALLWLGEGLGLAIDLGGSLLRGARGGAGEIGYMPLGGDPKMDLQDLVGGEAVVALARRYGHPGDTAEEVVAVAVQAKHEQFLTKLAGRIAVALAAVIAVLDPALVVLAGPVGRAGGAPLRDAVTRAMHAIAPLETTVEHSTVADDPVLLGGLDAGLTAVREALIHSLAGRS
jgi:predicted NBD/HSP70 family sugar kinase